MSNKIRRKDKFLLTVRNYADNVGLFNLSCKYLVTLSGGADSVALLLTMKDFGYDIEAVHCNFMLRGEESFRDERFCVNLCKRLGVKLHIVHFDTKEYASLHKVSIEMAARELRYSHFEKLRNDIGASGICVAHHRDDCVETIILNFLRGTGVRGLCGIRPRNGYILRPLLCVGKNDILDYLSSIGQYFVTDSTNLVDDVMRNKVRLDVLPLLESINPNLRNSLIKMSDYMTETSKIVDDYASASASECIAEDGVVDISKLKNLISPEFTLYSIVSRYGFSSTQTDEIMRSLDNGSGHIWISDSHELLIDRNRIIIAPKNDSERSETMKVPECGIYICGNRKFSFSLETMDEDFRLSRTSDCVCLDADKVVFPLFIRHFTKGERFIPFGMKGSRLVSDYLTDRKKTLFQKRVQLVVSGKEGCILWLVGERPDNRYRITDRTQKILRISVYDK